MEKYGVDEDTDPSPGEKQAGVSPTTCPTCGSSCRVHGSVKLCPTHGSKPFESNGDKQE